MVVSFFEAAQSPSRSQPWIRHCIQTLRYDLNTSSTKKICLVWVDFLSKCGILYSNRRIESAHSPIRTCALIHHLVATRSVCGFMHLNVGLCILTRANVRYANFSRSLVSSLFSVKNFTMYECDFSLSIVVCCMRVICWYVCCTMILYGYQQVDIRRC